MYDSDMPVLQYTSRKEMERDILTRLNDWRESVVVIDDPTMRELMGGDPQPFADEHALRLSYEDEACVWMFQPIKPIACGSRRRA